MSSYTEARGTILQLNKAGHSDEAILDMYKDWNKSYDEDVNAVGYQGPKITAEELGKCWKKDRHAKSVVDIASGTGLVGEELHKLGFRIIDALDPSQHMLDVAKEKNVYRNFFCEYVTDEPLDIPENSYDGLTMSGALLNGHFKCSALPELIRLVKPGGYVVMVTRHENLYILEEYKERFISKLDELEKERKWKKVKIEKFDNYYMNLPGGYVVMVTRYENLYILEEYKERFISKLDELENERKWKKVKIEKFDNYYMNLPGVVIVYQIC